MAVLERHVRVFPLVKSLALLHRGRVHWLLDRKRRARRAWLKALDEAITLSIPAYQARAHYELGRHLSVGDRERRNHLERARALWERCGTRYWLERLYAQPS